MKKPQRIYGSRKTNSVYGIWLDMIQKHTAIRLSNGQSPSDFPNNPVAFETLNFGWILSAPDVDGKRRVLVQF